MVKVELCSDVEFEELLGKYDYKFKKGDLVKGIVCGYDAEGAIVDIGSKMTATVPSREVLITDSKKIEDTLEKGKTYEFIILKEESENDKLLLSSKKVMQAYSWKELEQLKESDETILGTIGSVVKGGLLVEIMGIRGFVPSSQLQNRDSEFKIGDKLELKILTLDSQENNFILSNKKVYAQATAEVQKNIFGQIEIGQVVKGKVVRITDFGAFIDIGGIDGLLPLSQLSWKWVDHPSDILKINDVIDVEIISIDTDKHRVSLSLKNLEPDPWIKAAEEVKEGTLHKGLITRIKSFGAFIEIYPGVEALLPQAELLEYQNKTKSIPQVGDKIETYVLKFNVADKRIALSVEEPKVMEKLSV